MLLILIFPQCDKCEGNYRCLNKTKTKCNLISNLKMYYYIDDSDELCTKIYDPKCINCTNRNCSFCIDSYFVFNGAECISWSFVDTINFITI